MAIWHRRNEWQQGLIIAGHPDINGNFPYILIARRTGFMDVTIGNHYYYQNSYSNADEIEDDALEEKPKKKGIIWIRRK